ncbi:hypothetical protein GCM10027563_08360 [Parasphingorhabdus pacifica]
MRVLVALRVAQLVRTGVVTVAQVRRGTGPALPARTSAIAASMAEMTAFDFGAVARWTVACANGSRPSGIPMNWTASAAATAAFIAVGSAIPMSSLACTTSLRAMNRGSSPASTILAR